MASFCEFYTALSGSIKVEEIPGWLSDYSPLISWLSVNFLSNLVTDSTAYSLFF
jgi:hypothetical protein